MHKQLQSVGMELKLVVGSALPKLIYFYIFRITSNKHLLLNFNSATFKKGTTLPSVTTTNISDYTLLTTESLLGVCIVYSANVLAQQLLIKIPCRIGTLLRARFCPTNLLNQQLCMPLVFIISYLFILCLQEKIRMMTQQCTKNLALLP